MLVVVFCVRVRSGGAPHVRLGALAPPAGHPLRASERVASGLLCLCEAVLGGCACLPCAVRGSRAQQWVLVVRPHVPISSAAALCSHAARLLSP